MTRCRDGATGEQQPTGPHQRIVAIYRERSWQNDDDGNEIQVEIIAPEKLYESRVVSEFGSALDSILRKFGESPGYCISTSGPAHCLATMNLR
jgi:hypothetical protein